MTTRRRVYFESLREAAQSCLANRLRTALGCLAIATAVGTVALVVEGLEGFARYSRLTSARAFGSDTFVVAQVVAANLSRRELADKLARNPPIRRSDVRFLDRNSGGDVIYAPLVQRSADITAGARKYENAAIGGTSSALFQIRELGVARGRFLRREDDERAAQVAVIGADIADALFPAVDPLGRSVRIGGRRFEVVGLQARQGSAGGTSLDRNVWIPLRAYERVFGAPATLEVFARAVDADEILRAEGRASATMRARRQLAPGVPDTFDLLTPEAARSLVVQLSERAGSAAAPISIMALLAAIVVVTNTTLVSVTQRTREIGVRRALGASRVNIAFEVVTEATLVAAVGGAIGLAAARLLLWVASQPLGLPLPLRVSTIITSLAAAGLSGVAAGWYPARRATRIDIVNAIRAE